MLAAWAFFIEYGYNISVHVQNTKVGVLNIIGSVFNMNTEV